MAETGHIKNVENFLGLISACDGYGSAYNPNNSALAISALQTDLAAGNVGVDGVTNGLIPWKVKFSVRENEYAGVGNLSTKWRRVFHLRQTLVFALFLEAEACISFELSPYSSFDLKFWLRV